MKCYFQLELHYRFFELSKGNHLPYNIMYCLVILHIIHIFIYDSTCYRKIYIQCLCGNADSERTKVKCGYYYPHYRYKRV